MAKIIRAEDLSSEELTEYILDVLHRIVVHHTLWFREVEQQLGYEKALAAMDYSWQKIRKNIGERLSDILGFASIDGVPKVLHTLPIKKRLELLDGLAKCWLAQDGVWFQAVEFTEGMQKAKLCNDATWEHFSPFEAWSIKKMLGLSEHSGLEGLEQALNFRIYGRINEQSTHWDGEALIFEMNNCRVQSARNRKGLADYPCKSAGLVEYSYFAKGIDTRIRTECVACPPDAHPKDWFCAWKFTLQ